MPEVTILVPIHLPTVHPVTVVLVHRSYQFIQWRAVIPCYQHQLLMDLTINHGQGRTLADMRPTWNRTQVQPSKGLGIYGRIW